MYGAGIAEIYDLIHEARGKDFAAEAELVTGLAREANPQASSLLDVACGTGAHLSAFSKLFDHTEGLELSEPMVETARQSVPGAIVHQGDMRDFGLGRSFDVVTCMFGSLGYLKTGAELDATLKRFASHLAPQGSVVVDPWWFSETYAEGYVAGGAITIKGKTVARVSHSTRQGNASKMDVHYLIADAVEGVRHLSETHLITLFSRKQYEAAFTQAGLKTRYIPEVQGGRGLFVGTR